ncbi:hypothetical protein ACFTSF_31545 [Kribbella sp. NPDC056951]|uniref:hypothetical protein n=1 Tax=Kribbella sp. NPDC056951 TaxID=3345978 RepID=UPI003634B8EA
MRIVSLLPSATEICFALGAGDSVVGVTFECDYPAAARTRRIVSTTALPEGLTPGEIDTVVRARVAAGEDLYKLDAGALRDLNPDIVITQDLCAVCALDVADVESALNCLGCTAEVVTTNPHTLAPAAAPRRGVGRGLEQLLRAARTAAGGRDRAAGRNSRRPHSRSRPGSPRPLGPPGGPELQLAAGS